MAKTNLAQNVPRQKANWSIIFLFALVSALAGYAAWYGIYKGYSFGNWMLFIALYYFTGFGITAIFHRLETHGGFRCNIVLETLGLAGGCMAAQKSPRSFVGTHRLHHKYADEPMDPHSPRKKWVLSGPFWAHMGWLMFRYQYTEEEFNVIVRDLDRRRLIRTMNRLSFPLVILGFVLPLLLFGWEGVLLSGFLRLFMVHHITFSVNSLCHMERGYFTKRLLGHFEAGRFVSGILYVLFSPAWLALEFILLFGSQRKEYREDPRFTDDSQNNLLLAFLTLGESMHNNHHFDPRCAFHGLKWYQPDPSRWLIKLFSMLHSASGIETPRKISPQPVIKT